MDNCKHCGESFNIVTKRSRYCYYCTKCYYHLFIKNKFKFNKGLAEIDYIKLSNLIDKIINNNYLVDLCDLLGNEDDTDIITIWNKYCNKSINVYNNLSVGKQLNNMWNDILKINNNYKKNKEQYEKNNRNI